MIEVMRGVLYTAVALCSFGIIAALVSSYLRTKQRPWCTQDQVRSVSWGIASLFAFCAAGGVALLLLLLYVICCVVKTI
jgi:4-hydroxybenzoate polyprenyltransferase